MRGDLQTECQGCQTEKKKNTQKKNTQEPACRTKQPNASIETKDWLSNDLN